MENLKFSCLETVDNVRCNKIAQFLCSLAKSIFELGLGRVNLLQNLIYTESKETAKLGQNIVREVPSEYH